MKAQTTGSFCVSIINIPSKSSNRLHLVGIVICMIKNYINLLYLHSIYVYIYIHNIQLTYQPKTARKKNLAVNSPKRETERWPSHNPCAPCKNRWRDKCNASFVEGWAPMTCKWLGSPLFISHEVWPFGRGPTTPFRGPTITMVINHLLNGMILQVSSSNESLGQIRNGEGWCIWPKKLISFRKKKNPTGGV